MVGRHLTHLATHDEKLRVQQFFDRVIAGEACTFETFARTAEERPLTVALTTAPLYSGDVITGAFAIIRDITGEREAARRIREQGRALIESARRMQSLFADFPDGAVALAPDGTILDANDAALKIGGYSRDELVGHNTAEFVAPDDAPALRAWLWCALDGQTVTFDARSFSADGRPLDLFTTMIPQREGDEVIGVFQIVQDVTDRRRSERLATAGAARLRDLYDIAAGSDFTRERMQVTLEFGCKAFSLDAGAVVAAATELTLESIFAAPGRLPVDDSALLDLARRVMENTATHGVLRANEGIGAKILVNGESYGAIVFATALPGALTIEETDADLLGLMSTLLGSSIERQRVRANLRALAYNDALTGLPNRVYVHERLHEAIEVAQSRMERVAVLVLDLDRFKDVNDTLGHARGDRLLQLVAERLKGELWDRATVARMGGDEFALIVPDCGEVENVRDIADRILALLAEPFALDEYEQFISTSIGIAMYPEHGNNEQALVKNADIAMYRAKDRGRNTAFVYNSSLEAPIHMRLSQERLLRRALDLHEFTVHYQPQIDLRSGAIVSVEALVRWNHPKSGLIAPKYFIPSAEISGLIVPLGDWVLATAARQVRQWQEQIGPLRLAVNLSPKQFHRRDLLTRLLGAASDAGLDPHTLELEITETVAMNDADTTMAILRELKNAGVRIAVDDFGTGYSSLGYLRRFEIDVLKIDQSFVTGIGIQPSDETIVRTVLAMAHSLGLVVVAEGVETETQLAFLREHDCDLVQGFVFAPPLPPEKLEALLRRPRGAVAPTG